MDNLILIHCILLLVIVLAVLLVFIWADSSKAEGSQHSTEKYLLACSSLAGIVVLHLNFMFLPNYIQKFGDLLSFALFLVLATLCFAPLLFLARKQKETKKQEAWTVFINSNHIPSAE